MYRLFLIVTALALATTTVADASPRPRNLRGGRSFNGRGAHGAAFRSSRIFVDPGYGQPTFAVPSATVAALSQSVVIVQQLDDGTFVGSDGALYSATGTQLLSAGNFAVRSGRVVGLSAAGRGRLLRANRVGVVRRGGLARRGGVRGGLNRRGVGGRRVAPMRPAGMRGGRRR